ncbi:hypothetical protein [Rhodococcus ruber]
MPVGEPAEPVDTGSTRQFETLFGTTTYHEIPGLIAEPLRRLLDEVASGHFADEAMDVPCSTQFHRRIPIEVMPDIARRGLVSPRGTIRSEGIVCGAAPRRRSRVPPGRSGQA